MNTGRKQKTLEMKANDTPHVILLHDTSHETFIVLKITEVKSCYGNTAFLLYDGNVIGYFCTVNYTAMRK